MLDEYDSDRVKDQTEKDRRCVNTETPERAGASSTFVCD